MYTPVCTAETSGKAGKRISERLNLHFFLGGRGVEHTSTPPSLQYLRGSNLSFRAYTFKTSRYDHGSQQQSNFIPVEGEILFDLPKTT